MEVLAALATMLDLMNVPEVPNVISEIGAQTDYVDLSSIKDITNLLPDESLQQVASGYSRKSHLTVDPIVSQEIGIKTQPEVSEAQMQKAGQFDFMESLREGMDEITGKFEASRQPSFQATIGPARAANPGVSEFEKQMLGFGIGVGSTLFLGMFLKEVAKVGLKKAVKQKLCGLLLSCFLPCMDLGISFGSLGQETNPFENITYSHIAYYEDLSEQYEMLGEGQFALESMQQNEEERRI